MAIFEDEIGKSNGGAPPYTPKLAEKVRGKEPSIPRPKLMGEDVSKRHAAMKIEYDPATPTRGYSIAKVPMKTDDNKRIIMQENISGYPSPFIKPSMPDKGEKIYSYDPQGNASGYTYSGRTPEIYSAYGSQVAAYNTQMGGRESRTSTEGVESGKLGMEGEKLSMEGEKLSVDKLANTALKNYYEGMVSNEQRRIEGAEATLKQQVREDMEKRNIDVAKLTDDELDTYTRGPKYIEQQRKQVESATSDLEYIMGASEFNDDEKEEEKTRLYESLSPDIQEKLKQKFGM